MPQSEGHFSLAFEPKIKRKWFERHKGMSWHVNDFGKFQTKLRLHTRWSDKSWTPMIFLPTPLNILPLSYKSSPRPSPPPSPPPFPAPYYYQLTYGDARLSARSWTLGSKYMPGWQYKRHWELLTLSGWHWAHAGLKDHFQKPTLCCMWGSR